MADTEATLTNDDSSKDFLFRAIAPFKDKTAQNVIAIPLVNTGPSNTFLFRFSGKTNDKNFVFALFDDGTDVSNGTEGGGITTVNQQIAYLRDTIFGDNFDISWTFVQSRYAPGAGITCVITALEFDNPKGHVGVVFGAIALKQGRIGSL